MKYEGEAHPSTSINAPANRHHAPKKDHNNNNLRGRIRSVSTKRQADNKAGKRTGVAATKNLHNQSQFLHSTLNKSLLTPIDLQGTSRSIVYSRISDASNKNNRGDGGGGDGDYL